jgi:methionyl aminopeptidase
MGYIVTREYTGHGVGKAYARRSAGAKLRRGGNRSIALKPGMTIALEPMVLVGTYETRVLPDKWTVVSADGSLTAHFEHTVAVTEGEPH